MRTGLLCLAASVAALSAACVGQVGDPGEGPDSGPQCDGSPIAGPAPIRRMTRFEYNRTVNELLGDATNPAVVFGAEEEKFGFNNNAAELITSQALAEQFMLGAEGVSERATEPITKNLPCDPVVDGEEACAEQFIDSFGRRAFRRPLTDAERALFMTQYNFGRTQENFRLGIRMVIETALQSPAFLYRVEFGVPAAEVADGVISLSSWEMASRLSFFLWGSMPDEELFAAAEADELSTPAQVEAAARRMVDHPNARVLVGEFHKQWLDYERVANVTKDAALYPDWSPQIGALMAEETSAFIDHAVFDDAGDVKALLGAPYSFMNQELADFYGQTGVMGETFQRVELDPAQHAGILTSGTLLVINSHTNQTSPTLRGKMIREQLFCDIVPPPPPEADITPPEIEPGSTGKDRFAQHTEDAGCAGCHMLMDPIGFGFESFDTVARFRTEENGNTIDATGALSATDVNGEFDGPAELAVKLSSSEEVTACYAKQWFRYGYGRGDVEEDVCTLQALNERFTESGGNIKELLVMLTQTDVFLYRQQGSAP